MTKNTSLCLVALAMLTASLPAAPERFGFAALGCVPYSRSEDSRASFLRLIAEINRRGPVFTVHLGDILGGDEAPTDQVLHTRLADFNTFTGPLIYTPGDNEWTDSHTKQAGSFDPLERLAKVRSIFFTSDQSLGGHPIALDTQHREPAFAKFVENARWTHAGIVFATVHVVGSSNNDQPSLPGASQEYLEREAANEAWIKATFALARSTHSPGVALFFQADPFAADLGRTGYGRGYERFLRTIEAEARAFGKPVLLVHADEHRYRLDVGVQFVANGEKVGNVTRLETFGDRNIHGVFVAVDPESTDVFLAGPLIVPGNLPPILPRPKASGAP